jgi:N6-L-threonylcarbamoyladenine synthase
MSYLEESTKKFNKLRNNDNVLILAFETSCDETSVSLVKNGREVLACIISTQIPIHERFGGVVPEVASRNHIMAISNVTEKCLSRAGVTFDDIDAIAVTYGAGLVGALLVGCELRQSFGLFPLFATYCC